MFTFWRDRMSAGPVTRRNLTWKRRRAARLTIAAAALALMMAVPGQPAPETGPAAPGNRAAATKIGPLLRRAIAGDDMTGVRAKAHARVPLLPTSPSPADISSQYLSCYVRLDSTEGDMSAYPGVSTRARSGDVALVAARPAALEWLAASPQVTAIELAGPLEFKNDVATVETGARSGRETYATSGSGVIIGFIGSGVDIAHPDLRNVDGSTRVLYLLDLSQPGDLDGDGLLDGDDYFGGTLYDRAQIDSALAGLSTVTGADLRGHETHVMGAAAGNGLGTANGYPAGTFAGVAPEADLIVVKSSLADLGYVGPGEASAGLAFVDSIAETVAEPYVVNMSFGTHLSAHDGTSLEERFIDNTIGSGVGGKAVIVAAGNEGTNYGTGPSLHCSKTLAQGEIAICEVTIPAYTPQPGELDDGMILDLWYSGGDAMEVSVWSPGGKGLTVSSRHSGTTDIPDGSIAIDNAPFADPRNSDNECFIQIDDGGGIPPAPGIWLVKIEATRVIEDGRFDLWLAHTAGLGGGLGFSQNSPVSNERLVSSPGNSVEAITVGSYVNKESWRDVDNNTVFFESLGVPPAGAIAPGSGPGPTRDGRTKPELTAPGRAVVSTLSKDAFPGASAVSMFNGCSTNAPRCLVAGDGVHAVARGTSFAAAHVAGAVALLFGIRPDLDAASLKSALAYSARPQVQSGGPWGYGKLDIPAAIEIVSASALLDLFTASETGEGVLVAWRLSPGDVVASIALYRAGSLRGPYELIHSSIEPEGSFLDMERQAGSLPFYRLGLVTAGGRELTTAPIATTPVPRQTNLRLQPPFPNPSRATTTIRFTSPATGTAVVTAFDATGRLVRKSLVTVPNAGSPVDVLWPWTGEDGDQIASGVYCLTVEMDGRRAAAKAIVLR